jgi:hypothetical protein
MVTVRMSEATHRRLLGASQCYAVTKGRASMNRFCVAAIEAALANFEAVDGESPRDCERAERSALEARFGTRFDALDAEGLAREAAEIGGGTFLMHATTIRGPSLLRQLVFERWAQIEAEANAAPQPQDARQATPNGMSTAEDNSSKTFNR